jgi:hypothetical protein
MFVDPATNGYYDQVNQPHPVSPGGLAVSTNNLVISSSNTAGVVTLATPPTGYAWIITGVWWSYNGTPTGGNLTLNDGSDEWDVDITTSGPGFVPFNTGFIFAQGHNVTFTIAAGGSGVVGKCGVIGARQIPVLPGNSGAGFAGPSSVIVVPGV